MYQLGHYGVALLTYAPVGAVVALTGDEFLAVGGAALCVSLSTLPDCDQRIPFVAHRGPTHTLLFALLVGVIVGGMTVLSLGALDIYDPRLAWFTAGIATLSICSHLLADALTPMGITPFWPLSRAHFSLNLTPAKNPIANYLLFGLGIGATILAMFVVTSVG